MRHRTRGGQQKVSLLFVFFFGGASAHPPPAPPDGSRISRPQLQLLMRQMDGGGFSRRTRARDVNTSPTVSPAADE